MTREVKSIRIALLTLIFYASYIFIEKGGFVLPLPLFEILFLLISCLFIAWNFKKDRGLYLLILTVSSLNLLSTQLFWSFFIDDMGMAELSNSLLLDYLRIAYYLGVLIWGTITIVSIKKNFKWLLLSCFIVCLVPAVIYSSWTLETLSFLLMFTVSFFWKRDEPTYLLWLLLSLLILMKGLSLSL